MTAGWTSSSATTATASSGCAATIRRRIATKTWLQLGVRGLHDPFGFRKGPAAADFDGDGRLELVAVDSKGRVCIFAQGPGADGARVLEPPVPLRFADGAVIMNGDIGQALADAEGVPFPQGLPGVWREPAVTLAACDWTGTGTLDLIASSCWYTFVMENVGSNAEPRFDRPAADPGRAGNAGQGLPAREPRDRLRLGR